MAKRAHEKGKQRAAKVELVFNEKDRRDYLTGFKKRKQERRETAAKKFERRFKEEKNRIRNEKRNSRLSHGPTVLPDNMLISDPAETVTHDLESHTVSVAHISNIDLQTDTFFLGNSRVHSEPEDEEETREEEAPGMELKRTMAVKPVPEKTVSQRTRHNILQAKLKLQEKKNKQKSKNLQKHKARVRKNHMKLSHQLKRQKRKGTL